MEFPLYFNLSGINISAYWVFVIISTVVFGGMFYRLKKKNPSTSLDPSKSRILGGAVLGILVGVTLLSVFFKPIDVSIFLFIQQYEAMYIAILFSTIGAKLSKTRSKEFASSGDQFTYPMTVLMIINRIGIFLTGFEGSGFGSPTNLPFGVDFGDQVLRHPLALYESGFLILLIIFTSLLRKKIRLGPGCLFEIFICSYFAYVLLADFFRPAALMLGPLSILQWLSIGGLLYYRHVWTFPRTLLLGNEGIKD